MQSIRALLSEFLALISLCAVTEAIAVAVELPCLCVKVCIVLRFAVRRLLTFSVLLSVSLNAFALLHLPSLHPSFHRTGDSAKFVNYMDTVLSHLSKAASRNVCLAGDFNAKHSCWLPSQSTDLAGSRLFAFAASNGLT